MRRRRWLFSLSIQRNAPLWIRPMTRPKVSALGFRRPISASRRLGARSSDSMAFRLPRRVTNRTNALSQTLAVGIWGFSRESCNVSRAVVKSKTLSM